MKSDYPFFRLVHSPVTSDQLRPLDPQCRIVQFDSPLTNDDHFKLADFLRNYPPIPLRVFGHYSERLLDLSFLRHYPFLSGFQVDVFSLQSANGIEYLPSSLEYLGFGQTKSKISLKFLTQFSQLRELYLEKHIKDIDVIGILSRLERLTLRSISLPDLSLLRKLKQLWSLGIKLGGTKDLRLLTEISNLKHLELWMVKGLSDLSMLGEIACLQNLYLQALKNVTSLPSFRNLTKLRRVTLDTMKGLSDLSPVAEAPALQELVVVGTNKLDPTSFQPFKNHPALKETAIWLGTTRKNREVQAMLNLPNSELEKSDFVYM
jgi:internalin A